MKTLLVCTLCFLSFVVGVTFDVRYQFPFTNPVVGELPGVILVQNRVVGWEVAYVWDSERHEWFFNTVGAY